jgi:prepilin-type N-terminal cleavage/methylation domain-containing protein
MRTRAGFTLLEMIVAAAIFTAVVAGAYALFDGSRRLAARAEARADMLQTARAALRAIEADLRGAVMSGSAYDTGFIGVDGGSPSEPMDVLDFVSVTSPSAETSKDDFDDATKTRRSDFSKVAYWIEKDETKTAHGLVRERLGTMLPPESRTRREEDVEAVSTDVVGLNLRYYDGQWRDAWNSQQTRTMPRAVEVTLRVKRGEDVEVHLARFLLPVAAETPEATTP